MQLVRDNSLFCSSDRRIISDTNRWVAVMKLPDNMTVWTFQRLYRGAFDVVGGWPVIVAFTSHEDHVQAYLSI